MATLMMNGVSVEADHLDDDGAFSPFLELGTTGLRKQSGVLQEEFLRELSGPRAMKIYREMRENDATIGAILFAIEMLIRQVQWRMQAADTSPLALEHAALVDGMLFKDMSQSWPMLLSEILSMLAYGWSMHELVYKRRLGETPPAGYVAHDPAWDWWAASQYADGLIGWRKMPIRGQDTLLEWQFDRQGGLQGMTQHDLTSGSGRVTIPIDKALLFRTTVWKGSPEGRSLLRSSYKGWYEKKHIEAIEGIGIERDLAGLFKIGAPVQYFSEAASPQEKAILAYLKKMAVGVHRDEMEGLVTPLVYDEHGHPLFTFELMSTGGSRQFDVDKVIQRKDIRMAQTVLADVIVMGHRGSGDSTIGDNKNELFSTAITGFLDAIAEVFNRHAIPRLWALNALPRETRPSLAHGDLKQVDFAAFTAGVLRLSQAGLVFSPEDEAYIREHVGLPAPAVEMGGV